MEHSWLTMLCQFQTFSKVTQLYTCMCLFFQILIPLTSLVAQMVKCLPAIQETRVWSLGWEDPLEKEMATHSSTLAWKIPWMEETDRLQSTGSQSQTWLRDFTFSFTYRCEYQEVRLTGGHLRVCLAQWHYTISDLRLTNKNLKSSLTEKKISFTQVVSKTF